MGNRKDTYWWWWWLVAVEGCGVGSGGGLPTMTRDVLVVQRNFMLHTHQETVGSATT